MRIHQNPPESGASVAYLLQDEKPVAPASSDRTKLEIEAEPVEQREQLEQNEPEVDPESGKSEESKARNEISPWLGCNM